MSVQMEVKVQESIRNLGEALVKWARRVFLALSEL